MLPDTPPAPATDGPPLMNVQDAALVFKVGSLWGPKRDLRVLDDVSLDVRAGEIIALVGESGSGKTALGKAMLGIHPLTSGRIEVEAPAGSRKRGAGQHDLQMIFQDPLSSFNPWFTVGSSIALPLRMHSDLSEPAIGARVGELLVQAGLRPEHAERHPHEMSGGQLQRAAIARALALSPRLIVADEAVSKLDVSVRAQILNLLKVLNRRNGIAIVFITHDLGVARFLSDRVAVMYFGRIVELGPTERVMAEPRHPYTSLLLNARRGDAQAVDDAKPSKVGCNFSTRCSRVLETCRTVRPDMTKLPDRHEYRCFNPIRDAA